MRFYGEALKRMDKDTALLTGYFLDLAERSYRNNIYTFTHFLGDGELSAFHLSEGSLPPCGYEIYGGYENAGRVIIRFGDPGQLGYEQPWPVSIISVRPLSKKFAEQLTHRDILGALMNQGINRNEIGDILIGSEGSCFFCSDRLADTLCSGLARIRHTSVVCSIAESIPKDCEQKYESKEFQASSERIDGIVAKYTKCSRSQTAELFVEGKVFVNGRQSSNHSYILKVGDKVSVRGFGKFIYEGVSRTTKKGSLMIKFRIYV